MIPLIQDMGRLGNIESLNFLWWSLSLGACLGGNGTIIGASANVVVIGMSEKRGVPISFLGFMKIAFPLMIMSIILSMLYLLVWYYYSATITLTGTVAAAVAAGIALKLVDKYLLKADRGFPGME
jgi:di/tricarboxylate transporter